MTEKGNDIITVYKGGKSLEVTRKAFIIHYAERGYTLDDEKPKEIEYTVEYLQGLSTEDLDNVVNKHFKEAFDKAGIVYDKKATKSDLIALIPKK